LPFLSPFFLCHPEALAEGSPVGILRSLTLPQNDKKEAQDVTDDKIILNIIFYRQFQVYPKIVDRKRRFFSHPVILRGLMRGPQKVNDFLGCPAPKRCPERSEGTFQLKNLFGEKGWRSFAALRRCPERSEGMTKSPEKRFLSAILGL